MIKNIKKIADDYRSKNGNDRISNKDLLWYTIARFDEFEKRVSRLESVQKIIFIVLPIVVTVILFVK